MQPYFSIIIPSYNRADLIGKTIRSILDQTFQDFEIIVIDDCSRDNTQEVVLAFKDTRIHYHKNNSNLERSASRNKGIGLSKGKYITFLDSDDYYYVHHLQTSYNYLSNHSSEVYYQRYAIVDSAGAVTGHGRKIKNRFFIQLLQEGTIFHLNGIFIKKEIADTTLFREDMNQSEDYEFFIRLLLSHKLEYTNEISSALLQHEGRGVLNINKKLLIRNMELLLKYITSNALFMDGYKQYLSYIRSGASSYIALHLVLANDLKGGIEYYFKSIKENPISIFRRRSFAIVKHILIRAVRSLAGK